jgi:hypothetical protein
MIKDRKTTKKKPSIKKTRKSTATEATKTTEEGAMPIRKILRRTYLMGQYQYQKQTQTIYRKQRLHLVIIQIHP